MQVNNQLNHLFKELGFKNFENTFAILPKNYFFNVDTNEIIKASPLSLRKVSLDEISNRKIITYIEQGRLVVVDKNNNVVNETEFKEFLDLLLAFLKSQEGGEADSDKPTKTKQVVIERFKKLIESNKTTFTYKVVKQISDIISKHNKVVAENIREENHNSKAADEKHRKLMDLILYYIRMDSIKSEAEEKNQNLV